MKKATKSVTTPASPAPVPAKSKKTTTVKAAPAVKPVESPSETPKAKKAPAKKAAPKPAAPAPAPVAKTPAPSTSTTIVTAQIDVGFGNTLYLRGEGPGLSWEKGVPLDCVADDKWSFTFIGAERPVVFKFLLNDLSWSLGEDYIAAPGAKVVVAPTF